MNIDKNSLQKLSAMNDSELKAKILEIAENCGADTRKLASKLDCGKIKKSISSLSQSDIDRIMGAVGEQNAEIIRRSIENNGG